jgi:replicative DNA helicase
MLTTIDKSPPQSIEAEVAMLGSMMLSTEAICYAIETLSEEVFYKDAHRKIFRAIIELFEKDKPVDLISVTEKLEKKQELLEIGGAGYLTFLINSVPTPAHFKHYAKIVYEKYILRSLITSATQILSLAYESQDDAEVTLDKAEHLIFRLALDKRSSDFVELKEAVHTTMETLEALSGKRTPTIGVPSGFIDFDKLTSGFQKGELIIIAGRPAMGKSSFCLNIASYVAVKEKLPVGIFSLEMNKEMLTQRILAAEANIPTNKLRSGDINREDWKKLTEAGDIFLGAPLFIDDTPAISILELRAKARRLKMRHDVALLIVDYLQLIQSPSSKRESRQQEIAEISRSLKTLAKELNIPIIAVSQLSRAVEHREDKRPRLADLRESGAIEQDADLVAFIFREEHYTPTSENKGIAEIIIGKQRHGPIGEVKLGFQKEYTKFVNLIPSFDFY